MLKIDEHPLLELTAIVCEFEKPIGEIEPTAKITGLLNLDAEPRFEFSDETKAVVRDLLRHGGYKPTGRGKPASEYLRQAVGKGTLSSINLPVDVCNVVSLHSGLPISVVDLDRTVGDLSDLRVGIAPENSEYVFNATGQTIKLDGLLCLFDLECLAASGESQKLFGFRCEPRLFNFGRNYK